jgi:uncharacterized membrane protein YfcA
MLCGYGSGVVRNLWQETLDRRVILRHLPYTVPAALVGGYLAPALNVSWLVVLFGLFVFSYGIRMLVNLLRSRVGEPKGGKPDVSSALEKPSAISSSFLRERAGVRDGATALLGGLLLGLITVGLGELLLPRLLTERKPLAPAALVGSMAVLIFVTSVAAALVRLNGSFLMALSEQRDTLLGALAFAGPGALLGGQLGPVVAQHLNAITLRWYLAVILLLVGILMLVRFLALAVLSR